MFKNRKKSRLRIKALKLLIYLKFGFKRYIIRYIERIIPSSLLGQVIIYLITVIFIILMALVIFIYDHDWRRIRGKLMSGIANEVYYISVLINNNYTPINLSNIIYENFYKFSIIDNPNRALLKNYQQHSDSSTLSKNALILKNTLTTNLNFKFYLQEVKHKNIYILVILSPNKWCEFYISENVFFISALKSIVYYTLISYLLLIFISIGFFKFLLRPLKALSSNVIRFGKGEKTKYLRPKGGLEIRNTIKAFNEMQGRINRYIEQRTLMLSSISHDLKSVLTRMSLTVETTKNLSNKQDLLDEVYTMNQMIGNYLAFANNDYQEEAKKKINITKFFTNIANNIPTKPAQHISLEIHSVYDYMLVKPLTLKRAMVNLLENALKFGNNVKILIKDNKNTHLKIVIDDDGIGIKEEHYNSVFKPFYRINEARTPEKGSVGLGLSIVKDAITRHGGTIELGVSDSLGLRVSILLPY